jgi:hypothetical protein
VNLAHITGLPVEETFLQLAPAGAAILTAVAIAGRMQLDRMRSRLRGLSCTEDRKEQS